MVGRVMQAVLAAIIGVFGLFVIVAGPDVREYRNTPWRVRLVGLVIVGLAVVAIWNSFS